jgi:hypothetical protein
MFTATSREDEAFLRENRRLFIFLNTLVEVMRRTNKIISALIICFTAVSASYSQGTVSLSGIVLEKSTREAIPNTTVGVSGSITSSNEHGFFSIKIEKGSQVIQASFVGYKRYTTTITIEKDTTLTIELEKGIELEEVVIMNRQTALNSQGLGNIQLNVSQLRKTPLFLGERDIIKAMQFLPGVSSGTEGSSNLNIRGGTNDQTLYLLDDVPVYNQNHTLGLFSIFNPEVLRSAELYKGGIPAMYGNRLSGVANIYLKNGNMREHHQSLSVGVLSMSAHLEGPVLKDKLSYSIAARRSMIDLIFLGVIARIGHSGGALLFPFYDINAKTTWNITKNTTLSLNLYNGFDNLYGIVKDKVKEEDGEYEYDERYGVGWKTLTSSIHLKSSVNSKMFLVSNLYFTDLENFNYYKMKINYTKDDVFMKNRTFSELQELGLRTRIEHKINNNNNLYYGLELSQQQFKPNYMEKNMDRKIVLYSTGMSELKTLGLFLYDEMTYREWLLGIGLRGSVYNNKSKSLFAVEPRIKLNRRLDENNKIMLAYDYMTQPIHSINEMNYSIQKDFWVPFQENRLPYAHQFSAGWNNSSIPHLTVSVESYWKEMKNILRIDNLENYIDYHIDYVTGSGRSYGLEMLAQYDYKKLSALLSYTLSKAVRTFEGKTYPFKYDTPNNLSGQVSYDVYQKGAMKNTLSVNAQYHTGIPYYVSASDYPGMGLPSYSTGYPHDNYNTVQFISQGPNTRLSDYFRADINFTMEKTLKKGGRWVWQLSFLNATGHQNPYTLYKNAKGQYKAFLLIPFMPSFSYTRYF